MILNNKGGGYNMNNTETLEEHIQKVGDGQRRFENVYESITRMILDGGIEKVNVHGKDTFDFNIFREGKKPVIGMYDEINSFVSFVKDASDGGTSSEMAFTLVSEPGTGKTYFVDKLCELYREHVAKPENRRFTFRLTGLDKIDEKYNRINEIESQTFEDPMVLALNLKPTVSESLEFLGKEYNFSDEMLKELEKKHRPLGACSDYIFADILEKKGDVKEALKHVNVVQVPLGMSRGTLVGKYSARDKITSSSKDLLGEESISRLIKLDDSGNPYRLDLRSGALARVGGGGIHFSDEMFKNKKDLIQIYLGVIQNRQIELDGFKWPLDTLVIATSNNDEYNSFVSEKAEAPIIDRCRVCYVPHNTNYRLQQALTEFAIGSKSKTTMTKEKLHEDPNLNYAASVATTLSRLPHSDKLTPIEMMKLSAGEVAGEKSVKTLTEVIDVLSQNPDVTKRFGQKGIGQRNLGRAVQLLIESSQTQEGECMVAQDIFPALERVVLDYVQDHGDRTKYMKDLKTAKGLYKERIMTEMFNAYMDEPEAIKKDVFNYVNMVMGVDAGNLGSDKMWKYKDPQTNKLRALKIDTKYMDSVEQRLGLTTREEKESFRTTIRKIYGQKMASEPEYDFMDNEELVKAVTDVRLKSDVAGAASLVGALTNRTNEENQKLYNRMIDTMRNKLDYCPTCAQKTIEYFCEPKDET